MRVVGGDGREVGKDGGEGDLQGVDLGQAAPLGSPSMSTIREDREKQMTYRAPLRVRLEEIARGELRGLQHGGAPFVHARCEVNKLCLRRCENRLVVESDGVDPGFPRASFFGAKPKPAEKVVSVRLPNTT